MIKKEHVIKTNRWILKWENWKTIKRAGNGVYNKKVWLNWTKQGFV